MDGGGSPSPCSSWLPFCSPSGVPFDHTGHALPGDEHIAGWLLRSPDEVTIKFLDTAPGQTARVMLEEELVDAVVGFDGKVRLVAGPEPPTAIRLADLQAQTQAEKD
jgi:hypothetical protein